MNASIFSRLPPEEIMALHLSLIHIFHGTNDTDLLGAPASHGCIRLSPRDMLDLFALAEAGIAVFIQC